MWLNVGFYEGLQPQNVIFLFFKKHSYLLAAKTTPDVNNGMKEVLQVIVCILEETFDG